MDPVELEINRANTASFIAARPSEIVLTPHTQEKTTVGGYKLIPGEPKSPQTLRVIELGANQSPPILTLTDGKQREASFWLLGMDDADIAINDTWLGEDGRTWRVGDVVRPNGYETRGLVVERGK